MLPLGESGWCLCRSFLEIGSMQRGAWVWAARDFNAEMSNTHLQEFCATFSLTNLIKESTCFKNLEKPTGIDDILTNHPKSF